MKLLLAKTYNNLKENWPFCLAILSIAYLALFNHLGSAPIHTWDEGVYASNALEMLLRNNFIIKFYDGSPDMWATQPPLAAWIQTFFLMIFGISELVIRIPSAISGIVIVFVLIRFFKKEFNIVNIGFFSSLVLLTSGGYISYHVARTGDLDALVTMFSFIYIIYFYKFIKSELQNKKYLIISLVSIFCAFFTKSIAGFFYLPVLFLYLLISKKTIRFFKIKELYITLSVLLLVIVSYFWINEINSSGYINIALFRGITGRFSGTIDDVHTGPFFMYFTNLKEGNFLPWIYLLPLSIFLIFIQKSKELRTFLIYVTSLIIFYWLVISLSATKLAWYDAQLYPLLSILAGFAVYYLYDSILIKINPNKIVKVIFFFVFFFTIFSYPVVNINKKNLAEKSAKWVDEEYGPTLKKIKDFYPNIKNINILHIGFSPHVVYYKTLFNKVFNYQITNRSIVEKIIFEQNSFILFWHPAVFDVLNKDYDYSIIFQNGQMFLVKVKNRKSTIEDFYFNDFENLDLTRYKENVDTVNVHSGKFSNKSNNIHEFSISYEFVGSDLNNIYAQAKINAWILTEKTDNLKLVFSIEKENHAFYWKCLQFKDIVIEKNKWTEISHTFDIPKDIPEDYTLKVYFWNPNTYPLYIDDFGLEFK